MISKEAGNDADSAQALRPRDVIVPFQRRILFATALLLSLMIADGVVEHFTQHAREESALQINMSGRQRMLSQRISGFAQLLTDPRAHTEQEKEEIIASLEQAVSEMQTAHKALSTGAPELGLTPARGDIRRLYFNTQPSLDTEIQEFLDAASRVARLSEQGEDASSDALYIRNAAFGPLLDQLELAVKLFQQEAENRLHLSQKIAIGTRILFLVAVVGIMFGIVWPMVSVIRRGLQKFAEERNRANAASLAKSEFLATVSHEIRTPMNSIVGLSDLLTRTGLSNDEKRYAFLISESAKSLLVILNSVLDYSKIEAGKLEIEHVAFSPRDIVQNTVSSFDSSAAGKGLELSVFIAEDTPDHLIGDPTRLRQILTNFVSNAIKFTNTGKVTITLQRSDRLSENWADVVILRLEVADTGIGFPPEKKQQLFDIFSQADQSTTRQFGGTGLGLAIAKRLTLAMGGKIDAQSEPGQGAKFWVELPFDPVMKSEAQETSGTATAQSYLPDSGHEPPKKVFARFDNVLVVDDIELNRIVIGAFLADGPKNITFASNGQEAVEKAAQTNFDLIFLDAHMPIMNGIEALHKIRELPGPSRYAQIIVVTADALEEAESRYTSAGFDGYVSKPITEQTLARSVKALTSSSSPDHTG